MGGADVGACFAQVCVAAYITRQHNSYSAICVGMAVVAQALQLHGEQSLDPMKKCRLNTNRADPTSQRKCAFMRECPRRLAHFLFKCLSVTVNLWGSRGVTKCRMCVCVYICTNLQTPPRCSCLYLSFNGSYK